MISKQGRKDLIRFIGETIIDFTAISDLAEIILDSNELNVTSVLQNGQKLSFSIEDPPATHATLGKLFRIALTDLLKEGDKTQLTIIYSTSPSAQGICWLTEEQTADKKYPFVFTQGQAILSRSFFPCQDTPGRKTTASAKVTVTSPMTPFFAGREISRQVNESSITVDFEQKNPVPTYLITLAVGNLKYQRVSERVGVIAEESLLEEAVKEMGDTEKFISTCENYLNFPYVWDDFNILLMPPGFAYGGMENPSLCYIFNQILAGDKSLTYVVGHEVAHSWFGNLVTNSNWDSFYLNEGFTTFMERKLGFLLYGEENYNLEGLVGQNELNAAINELGEDHEYTKLMPSIGSIDPDNAFSVVPYEKGSNMLITIERILGEETFRTFLNSYLEKFQYGNVSIEGVKQILQKVDTDGKLVDFDWDSWLYSTGSMKEPVGFKRCLNNKQNDGGS